MSTDRDDETTAMPRIPSLEVISTSAPADQALLQRATSDRDLFAHDHFAHDEFSRDPGQWHQAIGVARQACARIFRDGGTATDAVRTFGLPPANDGKTDWSRAVTLIAESLCTRRIKRAA